MDTGDTGDTGNISQEDSSFEVISAAELAGESGGFSCSTTKSDNFTLSFIVLLFAVLIRIKK